MNGPGAHFSVYGPTHVHVPVPAGQGLHALDVALKAMYSLPAHAMHGPPAEHGRHEDAPAAPFVPVPTAHDAHAELDAAALYVLTAHAAHAAPAELEEPAWHARHAAADVEPVTLYVLVPAGHKLHAVLAAAVLYELMPHAMQRPPAPVTKPAEQGATSVTGFALRPMPRPTPRVNTTT